MFNSFKPSKKWDCKLKGDENQSLGSTTVDEQMEAERTCSDERRELDRYGEVWRCRSCWSHMTVCMLPFYKFLYKPCPCQDQSSLLGPVCLLQWNVVFTGQWGSSTNIHLHHFPRWQTDIPWIYLVNRINSLNLRFNVSFKSGFLFATLFSNVDWWQTSHFKGVGGDFYAITYLTILFSCY